MEVLDVERLRSLNADQWFAFLHDEYFRWKYTAPNRYSTTTRTLCRKAGDETGRQTLVRSRDQLLGINASDSIRRSIETASAIPGLGTAGASGLLALMYPMAFGTVDQFVVKALRAIPEFASDAAIAKMNPDGLTAADGELLVLIMRRKAAALTEGLRESWTPRMIDKVLWTYGHG